MYDLTRFGLKDMTQCGAVLRRLGNEAGSMEEAADRIVRHLHEHLLRGSGGAPATALVRLFKTHPYGGLEPSLRRRVDQALGRRPDDPDTPCFTLLASAGQQPEWNGREGSKNFQVIPIEGERFAHTFPMFSQLLTQFGVDVGAVVNPGANLLLESQERGYNVFHVRMRWRAPMSLVSASLSSPSEFGRCWDSEGSCRRGPSWR